MNRGSGFAVMALLLLGIALSYPSWWTGTPYGFGDDALEYTVPFASFVLEGLREGHFPLWNPYQDGGAPTLAQPPWMGPFHPGLALFAVLPTGRALDAAFALHVIFFALGTYGLARRRGISRGAALLAAWAVALGTPMRTLFRMGYLPETVALSSLPWLLLIADRALRERAHLLPASAAAGLLLGVVHLGGHLVASGVVVISLGVYAAALGGLRARREGSGRAIGDAIRFFVGAEVLGIALAAPQLLPLVEAGLQSSLGSGRPVAAEEYAYLEEAWRIGNFLFARFDPVAKGHVFIGTVLLVFLPLAWRGRGASATPPPVPGGPGPAELAILAAVSLLLLSGNATPIWTVLRAALPPLRIFSYFYFFVVPLGLALALLAAHGLDRWRTGLTAVDPEERRAAGRPVAVAILVLLIGAMMTLGVTLLDPSEAVALAREGVLESLPRSAAALALVGTIAWAAARCPRPLHRDRILPLLGLLVLAELLGHGASNPRVPELGRRALTADGAPFAMGRYFDRDSLVEALPEAGAGRVLRIERTRYAASWSLKRNEGLVHGYEDVERASKLPFARTVALTAQLEEVDLDWATALSRSKHLATREEFLVRLRDRSRELRILDLLGVEAIVSDVAVQGRGFARGPLVDGRRVVHRRNGPPRIYGVSSWDTAPDRDAAIASTLDPARDPWTRPAVEDPSGGSPGELMGDSEAPVEIRLESWRAGRLELESRSEGPALLVLGEMAHRGWRVRVDGATRPSLIANGIHLAVRVPAGVHRVEASYRPVSWRPALGVSALALFFALVVGRPFARMRVPPWSPGVPLWW